ncbi:hypothetical protein INR49_026776 [Caranx melampygus]|nr:hypothetical protein INR49_026776 [Caranx melampygus]
MRTPLGAAAEEGRGVSAAPQLFRGMPSRYATPSSSTPHLCAKGSSHRWVTWSKGSMSLDIFNLDSCVVMGEPKGLRVGALVLKGPVYFQ